MLHVTFGDPPTPLPPLPKVEPIWRSEIRYADNSVRLDAFVIAALNAIASNSEDGYLLAGRTGNVQFVKDIVQLGIDLLNEVDRRIEEDEDE